MGDKTAIAWTDHTFSPWIGCTKVSPGCKYCYAERLSEQRFRGTWGPRGVRQVTGASTWRNPVRWNKEALASGLSRRVFCGSLCDVFEDRPDIAQARVVLLDLIEETPNLDWQLLTKRPEDVPRLLGQRALPNNVWLGTSVESNDYIRRADALRRVDVPSGVRFISYEPALGPLSDLDLTDIAWLIYGGESGPVHRGHDIQWARDIRKRCAASGTAFFYKQSPAYRTEMGIKLDGRVVRNYPRDRRVILYSDQLEALR